jgi:hypothetical protein
MLGIDLRSLEVTAESESDARGLVGIAGIPTALDGIRMTIRIGADSVPEPQLRELAAWGEAHSAVGCTLREPPPIAVEITVV